jgi:Lysozyme like domain
MTPTEVAQIAYQAGFRGAGLIQAVAVSLAENGSGNPNATHVNTQATGIYKDSIDQGLWQINNVAHPYANIFDPLTNAKAAFDISGGGVNWDPWTTWPGAAGAEMVRAANAVANAGIDVVAGGPQPITSANAGDAAGIGQQAQQGVAGLGQQVATALANAGASISGSASGFSANLDGLVKALAAIPITLGNGIDMLKNLGAFFQTPDLWIRIMMVLGGGVLILIGLILTALSFVHAGQVKVG